MRMGLAIRDVEVYEGAPLRCTGAGRDAPSDHQVIDMNQTRPPDMRAESLAAAHDGNPPPSGAKRVRPHLATLPNARSVDDR